MPACGDGAAIDVGEVMAAIHDPAVQAALSAPGNPERDGHVRPRRSPGRRLRVPLRARGGGEFLVGSPCMPSSAIQSLPCVAAIPDGVTRLMTVLRALDEQQLQDPSCAGLR